MRQLIAVSALAAVAVVSVQANAATPKENFITVCEAGMKKEPLSDGSLRTSVATVAAIKAATGKEACGVAWTAATTATSLDLSGKSVTDISMLKNFSKLTSLNISGNEISDLSALGGLTGLTDLDASSNKVSDVSALGSLTALTKLNLAKNQITDIAALSTLTALKELRLNDNQIVKVAPLTSIKGLKKLFLSSNKVENLAPLAKSKKLVELAVRNNPVKNCPDKGKLEIKGKEIENTEVLQTVCKDEAYKKGN